MGVTKYYDKLDEKWYLRVYEQKQSKTFKHIRVQRRRTKIPLEDMERAKKLEIEFKIELAELVARQEGQGCSWGELVDKWEIYYRLYPTARMTDETIRDHIARVRNYTSSWMKMPCKEIEVGEADEVFRRLRAKGASQRLMSNVKGSISKIYKWGMERKYIVGKDYPPVHGLDVTTREELKEEKMPEVLKKGEIELLLERAKATKNLWYPIWKFDLYSGLRAQELNGLRKEDIDLIDPGEVKELEKKKPKNEINYGVISVKRQWCKGLKRCRGLKGKYWRTVPINSALYWWLVDYLPTANYGSDEHGNRVFERIHGWDRGDQARIFKMFCMSEGLKPVKFHTLRACWATQTLRSGATAAELMDMGGWRDYDTMMRYIRLAGIETAGATEGLDFEKKRVDPLVLPENVVSLFGK